MSGGTASSVGPEHPLADYVAGEERYVRFAEDILDVELAGVQEDILCAVTTNRQTAICSGNGVGKSYAVAVQILSFLYCNPEGSVLLTSGSYPQMEQTVWPEVKRLLREARERGVPLPGTVKEAQPRIEFDEHPTKSFRAISSTHPDALEGRHAPKQCVIVDEADKQGVDEAVLESARSSVTDDADRFVVLGNPPRTESNSFYDVLTDPLFETVNFTSFESRNVRADAGLTDEPKLPGLVDLGQVKDDWRSWHRDKEWPGVDACLEMVEYDEDAGILRATREDLDERWYRRRLGIIPPDNSQSVRPFYIDDVSAATSRWDTVDDVPDTFDAYGVDVARGGGDRTVIVGLDADVAVVLESLESPGDHRINERRIRQTVPENTSAPVVIDAIGEGSGLADTLSGTYNVTRFKSSENAVQPEKYNDKRTEALAEFGQWLDDGGAVKPGTELASELRAGSQHIEFEEKRLKSGVTWKATSKSELKKSTSLGRSPDVLDAATLAAWGANVETSSNAGFGFYSY